MRLKTIIFLIFVVLSNANAQLEPYDTDSDGLRNISLLSHIQFLSQNPSYWGFSYELDNDINLDDTKNWNGGLGLAPLGTATNPFTGVFDGHDCVITNLTINRPTEDFVGFFGVVSAIAYVRNIKITVASISGGSYVGIIAGRNFGVLDNLYGNGNIVAAKSYVGGITGENTGTIKYCRANIKINGGEAYNGGIAGENYGSVYYSRSFGEIQSAYIIGGLVGNNSGLISNCFSRVNVTAVDNYIGGLAGSNWETGEIINSYSTGQVTGSGYYQGGLVGFKHNSAKDSGSFWDTESSDIYESVGGEGKTTSEMKDASTFMTENWDFIDIWTISPTVNAGYPYIKNRPSSTQDNDTIAKPIITFIPNNASQSLSIDINSLNSTYCTFSIYNCLGSLVLKSDQFVLSKGSNNITHDIKKLSTGVYFAIIYLNDKVYTQKFIVE